MSSPSCCAIILKKAQEPILHNSYNRPIDKTHKTPRDFKRFDGWTGKLF
jgi:hypothetical protein